MDVSPQPAAPPPQLPPPPKEGCRCCAMGCVSMFVAALVGCVVLLACGWFVFAKMVSSFTSEEPVAIQVEVPNESQYAAANTKLQTVREASRNRQPVTMEFTADDLNALIARHPDFDDMRGKFRVAMADSILTLDLSVPLREVPLPGMKHRWLNGTARFGLVYHDGSFNFALHSLTANGRELPLSVLQGAGSTFNSSFNEGFDKAQRENSRSSEFWESVKTLAVLDDKLIITTKGREL